MEEVPSPFSFFQQKGNFIKAQWPQSSGKRLPCRQGDGGGALFDFLLGAQVVGVAPLLAAVDNEGYRWVEHFCRSSCLRRSVVVLGELVEGRLHAKEAPTAGGLCLDTAV